MCTNTRLIKNKWTGKVVRVSCGKCEACLQEKANARTNRIRNQLHKGNIYLFITLTYSPEFIPYVLRDELHDDSFVNVYRGNDVIDRLPVEKVGDVSLLLSAVGSPSSHIGVCYYTDVKNFFKRLRTNLKRHYHYEFKISYYACTELGPTTMRPHIHSLVECPSDSVETLRRAIVESWTFADKSRTSEYIEVARNASAYVASYVNCHSIVGTFHSCASFRPKHSYSKGFGLGIVGFSLVSVLSKIERRNLSYSSVKVIDGVRQSVDIPIPKYVGNRYFPKFKGYSLFTDDEIRKYIFFPQLIRSELSRKLTPIYWTDEDVHEYSVRISNLSDYYCVELGWSYDEFWANYPFLVTDFWNLLASTRLKLSFQNYEGNESDFYENISDVEFGVVSAPTLPDVAYQFNPNLRKDIVSSTANLSSLYYKKDKSRKVVNFCLSSSGHYV